MDKFSFLCNKVPGFAVNGSQVKVITEPSEFYDHLCSMSKGAKKRIVLASLYLGTGPKETHLTKCIEDNLSRHEDLKVKILLDYCRGNRLVNGKSSSTMLKHIVQRHPVSLD